MYDLQEIFSVEGKTVLACAARKYCGVAQCVIDLIGMCAITCM